MAADTRRQVRDSARYLRSVRAIEPDELADYVEGGAHPAVVRQLLREEAFDLGLVERDDGTFVPIPEGPLDPTFDHREGVTALPAMYDRALEGCLVEEFGPDWHRGESGRSLRGRLRRLKASYFHGADVTYDVETALAYAVYHLADFYAATGYVLDELGRDELLPRKLRVLDVGAGVGGPALALHDYCFGAPAERSGGAAGEDGADDTGPETPPARVAYHALEPGAGTDVLEELLGETDPNFRWTVTRERVEVFEPESEGEGEDEAADGAFDLVLFGNVLSELDEPVVTVERALDWLAPDGALVATAPADLETATGLRSIERALVRDDTATVYAPTVWLWADRHPGDRGWSFDRRAPVATPRVQKRLAEEAEEPDTVINTAVKFTYSLLRTDGRRRHDVSLDRSRAIPLGDANEVVTERVDLVVAKLSRDLRATGRSPPGGSDAASPGHRRGGDEDRGNPIYKIGDGSEREECYAVLVRETTLNGGLRSAGYGALLALENALVLWNDDEEGYNVVVDEETVVDVVGWGSGGERSA